MTWRGEDDTATFARRLAALEAQQARDPNRKPLPLGPAVSSEGASFGGPFAKAKGKLPWPVNGRLVAPLGFVDTEGQWALCTAGGDRHPRIEALADWLRRQLAA